MNDELEKLRRFVESVKIQAKGDLNDEQFRAYILKLAEAICPD